MTLNQLDELIKLKGPNNMMDKITKSVAVNYAKSLLKDLEEDKVLSANSTLNELTRIVNDEFKKQYWTHIETVHFEEKEYIKPFIKTLLNKGAVEVKPVGKIEDEMTDCFQIKMYDTSNSDLKDFIYKDLQGKQVIWMSDEYKKLYK